MSTLVARRWPQFLSVGVSTTLAFAILLSGAPSPEAMAAVGPRDRRLTNLAAGISVEAPAGWTLSQHTGYRDTLVLLLHPDGSRISVSAAATTARTSAELVRQNLPGLSAAGLQVLTSSPGTRGAVIVDLAPTSPSKRSDRLRQSYLVREVPGGWQAIVLTLVCREAVLTSRAPALEFVQTRMGLDEPAPAPDQTRGLGVPPASGDSGGRAGAAGGNGNTMPQQPDKR